MEDILSGNVRYDLKHLIFNWTVNFYSLIQCTMNLNLVEF